MHSSVCYAARLCSWWKSTLFIVNRSRVLESNPLQNYCGLHSKVGVLKYSFESVNVIKLDVRGFPLQNKVIRNTTPKI